MDSRELEQAEYDSKLRTVIVGTEGLHPQAQDVGDGRATIGWGYTLNRDNNVDIWARSGIELTPDQRATLARVDREPARGKTRIGLTFDRTLTEAEADSLFRASVEEYEGPATSAGMPLSDERVALVSVTYNRGVGALRNHPLIDAIRDGNRAEAWYQLRYNCWGSREDMEAGLRKRRFAESEVFGLYDDRTNVPVEEAAEVYAMYRVNRLEIDRVERGFGVTIDGTEARPNRIAQANRDYPDIVAEYGAVRTISDSLEPARSVLIEHLRGQYPAHADEFTEARFNDGEIDLERFPVRRGREEGRGELAPPAPAGHMDSAREERQGVLQTHTGPFADPHLNRLHAALVAGDAASADRIMGEFAQSPRGLAFLERGEQLLAQQQAVEREPQERLSNRDQHDAPVRA